MRWIVLIVTAAFLASPSRAWANELAEYQAQVRSVEKFFSSKRIGSSRDQLLVKRDVDGRRDPVGVIFGLSDDGGFCSEIAQMYMARYSASYYWCEPVN